MNSEKDIKPSEFLANYQKKYPEDSLENVRQTIIRNVQESIAPEKPKVSDYKKTLKNLDLLFEKRPEFVNQIFKSQNNIESLIGILDEEKIPLFRARISELLDSQEIFSQAMTECRTKITEVESLNDAAFKITEIMVNYVSKAIINAFNDDEIKEIFADDPITYKMILRAYIEEYTMSAREFVSMAIEGLPNEISDNQ